MHKLIFLTFFALLCFTFSENAQTKSTKNKTKTQVVKKIVECKSNELSFPCPKGLKVVLNGETDGTFLAREPKYGYSIFVIAPIDNVDEKGLISDVIGKSLKTLFSKESQEYRWKDTKYLNDKSASKFEVGKKLAQGFNGKQRVLVDYRHISFNNKNIFVGYLYEMDRGKEAEELFNNNLGGGQASGCQDVVEIIYSITGEKKSDEESPCDLVIGIN